MEKDPILNIFDELRRKAREFDGSIERLVETWKIPHLLVGGYGKRTVETNACLDEILESLRDTNDKMERDHLEFKSMSEDMDRFLEQSTKSYQDVKEECDNIDIVLAEYGYQYKEDDSMQEKCSRDNSTNDSILNIEDICDLEVEFTPDLTWKHRVKK